MCTWVHTNTYTQTPGIEKNEGNYVWYKANTIEVCGSAFCDGSVVHVGVHVFVYCRSLNPFQAVTDSLFVCFVCLFGICQRGQLDYGKTS